MQGQNKVIVQLAFELKCLCYQADYELQNRVLKLCCPMEKQDELELYMFITDRQRRCSEGVNTDRKTLKLNNITESMHITIQILILISPRFCLKFDVAF